MKKTKTLPSAREIFGLNVRRARRLKEISQEELAFQAGMSRTYLSQVEGGARNISVDHMEALANALELELPRLLDANLFSIDTADTDQ
ncbi:helix-turn-helix transcriptional regulator [Herbaspirillum sp. LeCh32-8]|uniref:helix-turn-helix domain-containing protein n=1 Tax=Herbaspirillum sp. LeCh32-8 TaxID=2821356 RepID=UPI001AEB3F61|nr:helix-turn-helix transcriptional regulator [Herbaspirillum sp. LeCh32-8]MBP0598995.1 helix-turn-helix transcriptional regulator [Herbaspirillum sp. LeCh32-8]